MYPQAYTVTLEHADATSNHNTRQHNPNSWQKSSTIQDQKYVDRWSYHNSITKVFAYSLQPAPTACSCPFKLHTQIVHLYSPPKLIAHLNSNIKSRELSNIIY